MTTSRDFVNHLKSVCDDAMMSPRRNAPTRRLDIRESVRPFRLAWITRREETRLEALQKPLNDDGMPRRFGVSLNFPYTEGPDFP